MNKIENKKIIFLVFILAVFGIIMIYSSSHIWAEYKYLDSFKYTKSQFIFFLIGLVTMYLVSKINYKIYYKYANLILFSCFFLLILVLIPGIGQVRNGSRSWFGIGNLGIQPSEATKIAMLIFVSKYLSNNQKALKSIKRGVLPILIIIFICFGLIVLEPDFGTGMVIIITMIGLLFASGINLTFFTKIGILGLIGIVFLIIIAPYRMARIVSYLNPWADPLGSGFQIIQSLYAIGPGGLLGLGFLKSRQKFFYLPEPQTDFIFSIISEEFGFLGVIIVTTLFGYLFMSILKISFKCDNLFAKYLSFGIGFSIILQAILNLSVVIGLIPVTGVTLPFLSYGGSSLLVSMASIGIVLNVSRNNSQIG